MIYLSSKAHPNNCSIEKIYQQEISMNYRQDAPGDWGRMQGTPEIKIATEVLTTADAYELFLRSWQTDSSAILLILHCLGGHSGWYIDMGNKLASRGITVYAMAHRGFGRSGGLPWTTKLLPN